MALTILEGSTFCICDERGDICEETGGFFAEDTRFLSLFRLTINGETPLLLSSGKVEYFSAAFYLRNPLADGLPQDSLSIVRERFVGEAMQDRIVIENVAMRAGLVRARARGRRATSPTSSPSRSTTSRSATRVRAKPLPDAGRARASTSRERPVRARGPGRGALADAGRSSRSSARSRAAASATDIELEPRERWELPADVVPQPDGAQVARRGRPSAASARSSRTSRTRSPPGSCACRSCARPGTTSSTRSRSSVSDLASLRMRGGNGGDRAAARGRDAVVHDRLRPRHDHHLRCRRCCSGRSSRAARSRCSPSSRRPRTTRRSTPSRARSSTRSGTARPRKAWFRRYYGTRRRDAALPRPALGGLALDGRRDARRRAARAGAARARVDRRATATATATASSSTSSGAERGLDNQSWKDSGDSQRFADGRLAQPPIAPCEVQGYVYDAKQRMAELAREVWRDRALADRLDREADRAAASGSTRRSGSRSAAATTRSRSTATSSRSTRSARTSGHLLWSGIVPPERVGRGRRRADGRRALVGLGRPHDVHRTTPPTTRSRTTTAPSGPTTTP